MRYCPVLLAGLLVLASCGGGRKLGDNAPGSAASPDGRLAFSLTVDEAGTPRYQLDRVTASASEPPRIIESSPLGFHVEGLGELTSGFTVLNTEQRDGREVYNLPWGEVASVDAPFREVTLSLKHTSTGLLVDVIARLFDDGLGLRYAFAKTGNDAVLGDSLRILEELTHFRLPGDPLVNWGPGDWNSYENRLELTRFSAIDAGKYDDRGQLIKRVVPNNAVMTPVSMRLNGGDTGVGNHISIHEAALVNYPEMTLEVVDGGFRSTLAGSPNRAAKAVVALPFETPWRTIAVEERAIDLVANTLVLNLNPPNRLGDVSWFEPMTYAGVWWEMFLGKGTWDYASGQSAAGSAGEAEPGESKHAANTANVKRYIDFCAENSIRGLLVEGWNTGWEVWLDSAARLDAFDFVTPYPDYDLEEVVRYGRERDVAIVMHHETSGVPERYEQQMDTAYALMQRLGIHAVKSGYVGNFPNGEWHHGQYGVRHYRHAFETAARYQVAINPHEPVKPTGERRTLPNAISAEGARGMEYNAFGDYTQVNQPRHLPSIVYTRGLAGPFDYTPGIFNLEMDGYRGPDEEVLSTLGKQLGAYVVIYAPIQMVADIPESYRLPSGEYHPAMPYLREMATNWDTTYPVSGELGEYAVVARKVRDEDRYFLGGINGETDRDVSILLDFLPSGKTYTMTLYRDGADAHYRDNKTALDVETIKVSSSTRVNVTMVAAGGFGAVIK